MELYMVYRWPFHLGRAILQSEIVISIMLVRHLTAVGAIYKIVSGFSLNKLEIQHLIFMPNLIEILISKQLVGLIVTTMKYLVINGVLLKV